MSQAPEVLLVAAAQEVLEEAAFVLADPAPAAPLRRAQQLALIELRGSRPCLIWFSVPSPYAAELAANLMGCEPDDGLAAEAGPSAVGELLNMIAGAFVQRWLPPGAPCPRGVPELAAWAPPAASPWPVSGAVATVLADGEHLLRLVFVPGERSALSEGNT